MEHLADTFAALPAREGGRGRRRDAALRLVGRRAVARRTTRSSSRRTRARILGAVDVPTIHFGTGTTHLLARWRGRRRRDRARLARPDRRGLGDRRPRSRRAGQSRPCAPARALGAGRAAADRILEPWRAGGATSSTSATGCSRTRIPPISRAWSSSCRPAPRSRCGHDLEIHWGHPTPPPAFERNSRERARGARKGPRVRTAVVLMAYGSPTRPEDIPAYFSDIRGGRPVRAEAVAELAGATAASAALAARTRSPSASAPRSRTSWVLPVYVGMKHWTPRISEAVDQAVEAGAQRIVGLVLAPHYSAHLRRRLPRPAERAVGDRADLVIIESWHDHDRSSTWSPSRVRGTDAHVVFTAHSLPERILAEGDPYSDQLLETSRLVAERAGLDDRWSFAFQSESATGEPWLGPDILDHLDALVRPRASEASSSRRSGSSPTTWRSSGTWTWRRRERAAAARPRTRPHRVHERRRRRSSARWPTSSGRLSSTRMSA